MRISFTVLTKRKTPFGALPPKGVFFFSACRPYPVRQATCRCSLPLHLLRRTVQTIKSHSSVSPPFSIKWSGAGQQFQYSIFRHKRTAPARARRRGFARSGLALSVPFGDTSPKGRGKTLRAGPWLSLWESWQSRRLCLRGRSGQIISNRLDILTDWKYNRVANVKIPMGIAKENPLSELPLQEGVSF